LTESKQRQASVLLVEDEALIRMMIAGMVEELGHSVAGEAANITDALRLARTADFEIAILDINLGGSKIDPVAAVIYSRGLPFIFASGYGAAGVPEAFRDCPVLQKPFLIERLGAAIKAALK
jgi:DNA-binding NtrC family response regulator